MAPVLGRRQAVFAAAMLALALAPIVVTVGRAVASGWIPIFDAGYFTVRSRDVLTEHHPWLGAWSSGSETLDETVRNLGPLQLDLLAPFTKLDPYWGTATGVGVVAVASVVAVWWSARRVLGPFGGCAAMLATLALEAAVGSQVFIDPRQQVYLLLPFWALLWLTWATAVGEGAAVPLLVAAASLVAQTHFTFLLQTLMLVGTGLGLFVASNRRRWRESAATRWLLVGLGVALACWAQPFWDQAFGDGNLFTVFAERGGNPGVGIRTGSQIVAATALGPPRWWFGGSMGDFELPADIVSPERAWLTLAAWSALLAGSTVVAWCRGRRPFAILGAVAAAALLAALVAGAQIPPSAFSLSPQNYFWMWPTAVFLTTAVAIVALVAAAGANRRPILTMGVVGLAVAAVVAVVASRPVAHFSTVASERTAGERVGRPVLEQLAEGLRRHRVTAPVVVDHSRGSFGSYLRYVFLAELQRSAIEFTFRPGDRDLDRFGHRRCDDGRALDRIVLADAGGDPAVRPGEVTLAHVDAFGPDDEAELAELDRRFGDWLRDGTLELDLPALQFLAGGEVPGLDPVLSAPGLPATGLATTLSPWTAWELVDVPSELERDFDRWVDLQTRSRLEVVTILLAPVDDAASNTGCG